MLDYFLSFGLVYVLVSTIWTWMPYTCEREQKFVARVMTLFDYYLENYRAHFIALYMLFFTIQGIMAVNTICFGGGPG